MQPKRCALCQKLYKPLTANGKYCPRCRGKKKYYIPKPEIDKQCLQCSIVFTTRRQDKKFCSYACKDIYNQAFVKKTRICKYCKVLFFTTNKKEYCCQDHYLAAKKIRDKKYYKEHNNEIS